MRSMLIGHLEDIQRHWQLLQVLLQNSQRPKPTIFFAGGSISLQWNIMIWLGWIPRFFRSFYMTKLMTYGPYDMDHIIWFGNHRFSNALFCKKIEITSICLISEFNMYLKCLLESYSIRILIPQVCDSITSHHWSLECQPDTWDYISPYFVLAYI